MSWTRIWTDERGTPSSARVLLWLVVLFSFGVIAWHLGGASPDNAVWQFLTTLVLVLASWAAGPRLAQYIMPQAGAIVGSMAQALKSKRPFGPRETDVA